MDQKKVRVAVAGVRGKMGVIARETLSAADGVEYVGGLVRGRTAADHEFNDPKVLFAAAKPHVIVDFTVFPDSKSIALAAIDAGVRPVIGTSGYGAPDIDELRVACEGKKIGCVFAPNFGIAAVLMMKLAAEAAPYFGTVEIVEIHESGKKDAPSGTALATARRLAASGTFDRPATAVFKAEGARGAEMNGIGIHSLRLPGAVSHQEVIFGGGGETLRIIHDSTSRRSFMAGMLRAVRAAKDLTQFVDGLEHLL